MPLYCPQCSAEYRDGFLECADCRVPLVSVLPPERKPQPEISLVAVFETNDSFALTLAKASLDDAEIPYALTGGDQRFTGAIHGFGIPPTAFGVFSSRIEVAPEFETEARALLEPLVNPEAVCDIEPESEP